MAERRKIVSLLLILVSLGVVYVVASLVIRDIDSYLDIKRKYAFQKKLQNDLEENVQDAKMRFVDYKKYENYLKNFEDGYDKKKLEALLQNFFQVLRLEYIHQRKERDKIKIDRYVVQVRMKSPRSFFLFLQNIRTHQLPLKVLEPIEFKKDGGSVMLSFELDLYRL